MAEPTPDQAARGYTRVVTLEEMKTALQAAIDERGRDYVYRGAVCIYVDRNLEPKCGIGCALVTLDLVHPMVDEILAYQLAETPGDPGLESMNQPQAAPLFDRMAHKGILFTPAARRFAANFQERQDGRMPWGQAFDEALETLAPQLADA